MAEASSSRARVAATNWLNDGRRRNSRMRDDRKRDCGCWASALIRSEGASDVTSVSGCSRTKCRTPKRCSSATSISSRSIGVIGMPLIEITYAQNYYNKQGVYLKDVQVCKV